MRIQHDNACLWWKDWHSCSCGFLEEEIRNEHKVFTESFVPIKLEYDNKISELTERIEVKLDEPLGCDLVIPGTFIMCGEGEGNNRHYCSRACLDKARGEK